MNQVQEQRRYPRADLKNALLISPFGISQVHDISEGGLSLKTGTESVGLVDELEFSILSNDGIYMEGVTARIVWKSAQTTEGEGSNVIYLVGAQFMHLSNEDQFDLREIILNKNEQLKVS